MDYFKYRKGITLVTLIITIVIIIILTGVSVGIIKNNNYVGKTENMKFNSNLENYRAELEDYIVDREYVEGAKYDSSKLYADKNCVYYGDSKIDGENIKSIITTISLDDIKNVKIIGGKLVFIGGTEEYQKDVNYDLSYIGGAKFDLSLSTANLICASTDKIVAGNSGSELYVNNTTSNTTSIDNTTYIQTDIAGKSSYTVEVVYKELLYGNYNSNQNSFLYSDGFIMHHKATSEKKLYVGLNASSAFIGEKVNFETNSYSKITFTYNATNKTGMIYVNGKLLSKKAIDEESKGFSKIYVSGKKNYYEIRVYDRCLNLTEVMQNDAMDNLKYGIWKEI